MKPSLFLCFFLPSVLMYPAICQNAWTGYTGVGVPKADTQSDFSFSTAYWNGINFGIRRDLRILSAVHATSRFEFNHFFVRPNIEILTPDDTFLITAESSNIYRLYFAIAYKSFARKVSPIVSWGIGYNIERPGKVKRHVRAPDHSVDIDTISYPAERYFAQSVDLGLLFRLTKGLSLEVVYSSISNYAQRKFHNLNLGLALWR